MRLHAIINGVQTLDHAELRRRLDDNGMTLPDGRAPNASEEAWRDLLRVLRDGRWLTTWPDGHGRFPSSVHDLADEAFYVAHVLVAPDVWINVWPAWGTDTVFFDFDSREMRSQTDVDALSNFMRTLGGTVGGPVELSYEGHEDAFAVYDPTNDEFRWVD